MNLFGLTGGQKLEAAAITAKLKAELESLALGKTVPSWQCGRGSLSHGETSAMAISAPSERGYPEKDAGYCTWLAAMGASGDVGWLIGVTRFVSYADLTAIFERHWRAFCERCLPGALAKAEARRAAGGDLYGTDISIWF